MARAKIGQDPSQREGALSAGVGVFMRSAVSKTRCDEACQRTADRLRLGVAQGRRVSTVF